MKDNICFGEDFLISLSDFSIATADNNDAQDKVESLKALAVERGKIMRQTNISPEQIKTLLPIFNGASSLSILDAVDTWKKTLINAGIHKLLWGEIILSRLENPALSRLPSSVKWNRKFEDICSSLEKNFGGVLKASMNIMKAHEAASRIPDISKCYLFESIVGTL